MSEDKSENNLFKARVITAHSSIENSYIAQKEQSNCTLNNCKKIRAICRNNTDNSNNSSNSSSYGSSSDINKKSKINHYSSKVNQKYDSSITNATTFLSMQEFHKDYWALSDLFKNRSFSAQNFCSANHETKSLLGSSKININNQDSYIFDNNVYIAPIHPLGELARIVLASDPIVQNELSSMKSEYRQHCFLVSRFLLKFALFDATFTQQYINKKCHSEKYNDCLCDFMKQPLPEICKGTLGKPSFANLPWSNIHFNLSHSAGLIILAIGNKPQGVDLEELCCKRVKSTALVKRVLGEQERAFFNKLNTSFDITSFFFLEWTLKECLVKVLGQSIFELENLEINPVTKSIYCNNLKGLTLSFTLSYLCKKLQISISDLLQNKQDLVNGVSKLDLAKGYLKSEIKSSSRYLLDTALSDVWFSYFLHDTSNQISTKVLKLNQPPFLNIKVFCPRFLHKIKALNNFENTIIDLQECIKSTWLEPQIVYEVQNFKR